MDKRSLWQRKALKGSRLRLLIWCLSRIFGRCCFSPGAGVQDKDPSRRVVYGAGRYWVTQVSCRMAT